MDEIFQRVGLRSALKGVAAAGATFAVLGMVAALWDNPLFIRMTPAGGFEILFLALQSLALGLYVAIRRPFCSVGLAGGGGVAGFVGIACPICNKLLLLLFGAEALMLYLEPVRLYLAAAGFVMIAGAVLWEWRARSGSLQAPPGPATVPAVSRSS